jgi:dTDP-4-amino-4,6-dideoxygalactose transaminase
VKFSSLPPVRRAVPLQRGSAATRLSMERFFADRRVTLYASGTAALARAMAECAAKTSASAPEVILPAYGCPDLVAACVQSSVIPRLVDVAPSGWSYDGQGLEASVSSNTVAIVTVNLLGLGDSAAYLRRFCQTKRISLIQDSAQYLPRASIEWPGDYVVLSFGRGKPMNLLHGGALVAPEGSGDAHPFQSAHYSARDRFLASRAAAMAFNVLTRPHAYWLVSALPGTGLGEVAYRPLSNGAPLPERAWERVGTAFELYRARQSYGRSIWTPAIEEWSNLGILELSGPNSQPQSEPLRLALLAPDRAARDILVQSLNRHHLGASRFYGADLTRIAGIPELVRRQGPFPHASALADRLFTLPTHDLVTADTVHCARDVVRAWHRVQPAQPSTPSIQRPG